jgi:hypothetical protein
MKIKFTQDYIGRESAMKEYKAGETAEIPNEQALDLIRQGVAKEVWASIGAQFDPPKLEAPLQAKVVDTDNIAKSIDNTPPVKEEKQAQPKKPRKGKGKSL